MNLNLYTKIPYLSHIMKNSEAQIHESFGISKRVMNSHPYNHYSNAENSTNLRTLHHQSWSGSEQYCSVQGFNELEVFLDYFEMSTWSLQDCDSLPFIQFTLRKLSTSFYCTPCIHGDIRYYNMLVTCIRWHECRWLEVLSPLFLPSKFWRQNLFLQFDFIIVLTLKKIEQTFWKGISTLKSLFYSETFWLPNQ